MFGSVVSDLKNVGFSRIDLGLTSKIPADVIKQEYPKIEDDVKRNFTFPELTDGFLPFGGEMSNTTNRRDLCERLCLRAKYKEKHKHYWFGSTRLYSAVCSLNSTFTAMANKILEEFQTSYGIQSPQNMNINEDSFSQVCWYNLDKRDPGREFLQDRHEDGHLLTFVLEREPGFMAYITESPELLNLNPGEVVVFTGSLLTLLTNGEIKPLYHSVANLKTETDRMSFAHFVLPDISKLYRNWIDGKELNLQDYVNSLHKSFGNKPFEVDENGMAAGTNR